MFQRFSSGAAVAALFFATTLAVARPPNLLLLTVDDMSCDSVGAFGCQLADTTPRIDRLATQGLLFKNAHVQVGNCYPSRNVLLSGRYPHSSGVEGFFQVRNIDFPVMADLLKAGGYFVAIRGKVSHSTPFQPYQPVEKLRPTKIGPLDPTLRRQNSEIHPDRLRSGSSIRAKMPRFSQRSSSSTGCSAWDADLTLLDGKTLHKKNPQSYYDSTRRGIEASRKVGKPFCINVNVSDPHKPFYKGESDPNPPTRTFRSEEVPIPGFLFDHPDVRRELALYYSTVRRADDCVGKVLDALDDSGEADGTVVIFLSDHGMPFPFAKTQLYHHSTHTPWIVRWPGTIPPASVDDRHMISAVDALPTLLDIAGLKHPPGLQGRSFLPLLQGKTQQGRDVVFKEYNEAANRSRHPMRAAQTLKYLYIFNPWSNGTRETRTATFKTATYRALVTLAEKDPKLAAREKLFRLRVPEELYDIGSDPDALKNLINDPEHRGALDSLRKRLEDWMVRTGDPALEAFRGRAQRAVVEAYMERQEWESRSRPRRKKGSPKG